MDNLRNLPGFRVAAAATVALCIFGAPSHAHAWVKFCNMQAGQIDVAIAYQPKDAPGTSTGGDLGVTTEGWFDIAPGQCTVVGQMDASATWLYTHVKTSTGRIEGNSMLCVGANRAFKVDQFFVRPGEVCKPGWNMRGFRRIDASTKNWTENVK